MKHSTLCFDFIFLFGFVVLDRQFFFSSAAAPWTTNNVFCTLYSNGTVRFKLS